MQRFSLPLIASIAASVISGSLAAQASITPVAGFGTGGWLAPGAIPQLDTSNSQRGMAVNPVTGNIILVDRDGTLGNNAYVIDGATGAVLGTLVPPAGGYSGGTFVVNIPGCGDDGSIHVCNLVTSTASTFKVYSWASEADALTTPATVTIASTSAQWGGMNRFGDCFTVGGGGATPVQFIAAGSNSAAGTNSAFLQGLLDGSGTVTAYTNVPGTVTSSNGYRLGLTYVDGDTFIGTQGTDAYVTSFDGTSATLDATIATGAAQRPLAHAVIGGTNVLATVDSNSSNVFIYDITDPTAPSLLVTGNATSGTLSANANGTGGCGWGAISGLSGTLYAMSSNQGIQAFTVTVPSAVVINEVYYDAPGGDDGQVFVEIYGPVGFDVSGYTIQTVEGAGASAGLCNPQSFTFAAGTVIPASGVLVVADATSTGTTSVANADFLVTNFDFENGADAVQLLDPNGVCVDAVAYGVVDTSVGAASGCNGQPWYEGNPARDVFSPLSIERCPAGTDTGDNATDFTPNMPSPGVAKDCCQAMEFVSLGTGSSISASASGKVGFDFFLTPCGGGLPYVILASLTDPATTTPPLGLPVYDGSSPFWLDAALQGGQFISWYGTLPADGRSVGQASLDFTGMPVILGASFPLYVAAVAYDPSANYTFAGTNAVQITINP